MTYRTDSPTVKCEKCEERLTDFEAYENHMAHMHGSSPSEESVVDWTLITDEDIITKDGNKYRVGGESINWSPNFDKEAREFLESKYQKDKIEILSKKKIGEAKKFVKALEFDTKQHYDKLLSKINGDSEYNKLYPNAQQRFPQNFEIGGKPFSQQRDQTSFQKINDWDIKDHGIEDSVDDPNAVMGSQTKKFSKGKYHIDEPVAKEQFSTSFYGDYLGESKANEGNIDSELEEYFENWDSELGGAGGSVICRLDGVEIDVGGIPTMISAKFKLLQYLKHNHPNIGNRLEKKLYTESKASEYEEDEYDEETGELLTPLGYDEDEWIDDSDVPKSGHYESWTFTNKHGVDYELDDEDGGLYNDLYYQQIDDGDEQEVFELLDRYNENYPYASKKDMENEIERTIGWVSDDRDIQTLVLQWEDSRYS